MNKVKKVLVSVLIVAVVSLGLTGCKSGDEHPSSEHPSKETLSEEHPSKELPSSEHPSKETPSGEHPE